MDAVPFIRGVTVSGGEPTIHHKKLVPLFQKLREEGLTCYLDSSGFFEFEAIRPLIDVTDKFLFDLKGEGLGLQSLCFDRQKSPRHCPSKHHSYSSTYQARKFRSQFEELGATFAIK